MIEQLSPVDQLTYCTVRIVCALPGGSSVGTGFMFNFLKDGQGRGLPCIVTNKHVIEGADVAEIVFHVDDGKGMPQEKYFRVITFDDLQSRVLRHPDPSVDLCAIPIGASINQVHDETGEKMLFIHLDKNSLITTEMLGTLNAVEDVIMVGYPSGIWDKTNNLPVVRRGITASHPAKNFNGIREFLIDAACFHGSSGSPVVLFNQSGYTTNDRKVHHSSRLALLGVLYSGPILTAQGDIKIVNVPTVQTKAIAVTQLTMNLGLVINADRILELEPQILELEKQFEQAKKPQT